MEKRWLLIFLLFEKSCFTTMAIMVDDDKLQKQGAEIELFYALFFSPFDEHPGAKIRTHNRSIESNH